MRSYSVCVHARVCDVVVIQFMLKVRIQQPKFLCVCVCVCVCDLYF